METPGSELSRQLKEWVASALYVPRYCVWVGSRLNIAPKRGECQASATAWCLYRMKDTEESGVLPYSFAYQSFDPEDENSIEAAADFVQAYFHEFHGEEILTDFDETTRRFDSRFSLPQVMAGDVDQSSEQRTILQYALEVEGMDDEGHLASNPFRT